MPLTKVIMILVVVVDFNMKPNLVVFLEILSLRKSLQLREDLRFAFFRCYRQKQLLEIKYLKADFQP